MKKVLFLGIVLFILLGQGFLFADRKAVDDFLKSYEAVVVETETLSKKAVVTALDTLPLSQKALDFAQKADAIQKDPTWTMMDMVKLGELSARYAVATEELQKKLK